MTSKLGTGMTDDLSNVPDHTASKHNESTAATDPVPGGPLPVKEKLLDVGASALQNFDPVKQICQTVCGLHCYAHDGTRQVKSHHYCTHLTADMRQCIIYDSDKSDARLIGIEYIISRKLFETLPMEERKYWHSHQYEVKSGMLVAPGLPTAVELQEMQTLVDTYGKTWHLWQVDRGDALPFGPAQLMMSFNDDGQVDEPILTATHSQFGYNPATIRKDREKLSYLDIIPEGCDVPWRTGKGLQTEVKEVIFQRKPDMPLSQK